MSSKTTVIIDDDTYLDLKLFARYKNASITTVVTSAIRKYLEINKEELEFAKRQEKERYEFSCRLKQGAEQEC